MAIKRDTLTNLKLNVGNERLYLDVDEMMGNVEMNLPKFEFFKMMLDTVCNTVEDVDDNLGVVSLNKLPVSSKLAINTLIKYKIIKKL